MAAENADEILRLTEAACRGDRGALDALVVRFLPQLRAFIRLRSGAAVRVQESSSDLVQSVCREVLENAERFRHPSEQAFKQWLFLTALRKIQTRGRYHLAQKRDARRQEGTDPTEQSGAGFDQRLATCYSSFSSPSRAFDHKEQVERVERAFDDLSEEQREVVTLAHLVGLSRGEIAQRMGKSEGAVRSMLNRALAHLSELLEDPPQDAG